MGGKGFYFSNLFWFCSVFDLDKVICDEKKEKLNLVEMPNLSILLISFPSGLRQIQTGVSLPFVKNSGWES